MSINGSRGLATAVTDELAKDKITYVDLIELHFDSASGGVQRLFKRKKKTDDINSGAKYG